MVTYKTNKENFKLSMVSLLVIASLFFSYFIKTLLPSLPNNFVIFLIYKIFSFFISFLIFYNIFSASFFKNPCLKNQIPNFNGTWKGKGESSFNNKKFDVEIEIKQNFHNISINAYFNRSKSKAINAFITNENGKEELVYNYQNDPKANSGLDIHYGTIVLEKRNNELSGNYFTNRGDQTKGKVKLVRARNKQNE